ncbi:lipopolysaccharide biosynthesis protein [Polaribacter marinivivus]|uniref:lipopolysaccharide biosynthesis protein n=1 Tax=Polaribacter marinivivus TaxID=1524260 RepID=UPI003D34089B
MLLKNSIKYILSSATSKLGALILLPIYIKYLSVEDFGYFYLCLLLINVFGAIGNLGVLNSLEVFINKDEVDKHVFFSSTVSITLIGTFSLSLFIFLIGLLFKIKITFLLAFLFLFLLRTFFTLFQRFNSSILDATRFFKNDFLFTVLNLVSSSFVLIYCDNKILFLFLAQSFSLFFILINESIKYYKYLINPKLQLMKDIFSYSLPLLGHTLLNLLPSILDKLIIKYFIGDKSLGYYSMSLQIGDIQNILTTAFNKSFAPIFHKSSKTLDLSKNILIVSYFFLFVGFIGSLFLNDVLSLISDDKYLNSYNLIPIVVSAYTLNLWYYFNSTFILGKTKKKLGSKIIFKISLENTIITILLIIISVPLFGIKGAIYCFLFSKILLTYRVTKKSEIIKNNFKNYMFFLANTITLLFVSVQAQSLMLLFKILILIIISAYMIYLFRILKIRNSRIN